MDFDELISYYEMEGMTKDLAVLTTLYVVGNVGFRVNDQIGFTEAFRRLLPAIEYTEGRVIETQVTPRLVTFRAEMRYKEGRFEDEEVETIRKHVMKCQKMKFKYENPYASYVASLLPPTTEGLQLVEELSDLFEASAKFNHEARLVKAGKLYIDFDDVDIVHEVYWKEKSFRYDACLRSGREYMRIHHPQLVEEWDC